MDQLSPVILESFVNVAVSDTVSSLCGSAAAETHSLNKHVFALYLPMFYFSSDFCMRTPCDLKLEMFMSCVMQTSSGATEQIKVKKKKKHSFFLYCL